MKNRRALDRLGNHKFASLCLGDAVRITGELGDHRPLKFKPSWKREPSEYEYYQLHTGHTVATLLNACQQLTDSVLYISAFAPSNRMKKHGITRQRHLQYSIESYIVRAQSIYDKLLFVVDAVFHLGNDSEIINHKTIVTNKHVKMSGFDKALKGMSKLRGKYQFVRNDLIHHSNYNEEDLHLLQGLSLVNVRDSNHDPTLLLKELTRDYVRKKISEFNDHTALLFEELDTLFTALLSEYEERKGRLSPNPYKASLGQGQK